MPYPSRMRTITATRYVTPLREGGSLPAIVEADDEQAATAFMLSIASAGNIRMETLRAFSSDEMGGILGKLP